MFKSLKNYLEDNILVTDGAMGTYYSQITGKNTTLSELANKVDPETVSKIHQAYIKAGARLIRTNTFSVNSFTLQKSREEIKRLLTAGYEIAEEVTKGNEVFVTADIGPIPDTADGKQIEDERIWSEYKFIVDVFLELGADIFTFETFSDYSFLKEIAEYIKEKNKNTYIMTQFALTLNGCTRKGITAENIFKELKSVSEIDAYGFNCGVGPTHLYNIMEKLDFEDNKIIALPNAGYPEIINERTIYANNPDYFAEMMIEIKELGTGIIGGCCGTTPLHIKKIVSELNNPQRKKSVRSGLLTEISDPCIKSITNNNFAKKIGNNEFIVAVELDPPFSTDISNVMEGARVLKNKGIDVITIADSPLGRVSIDSMVMGAKMKREIGIEVLPHLCCRDNNIIGLKSKLLAGYVEGLRNILVVTGDPIPSAERSEIKSVFNLNSFKLMELVSQMNEEDLKGGEYQIGGALNLNTPNREVQIKRMYKKIEAGANFFLTQPIFEKKVINYIKEMEKSEDISILAGIMPLVSYKNARFINNEVPGITIPSDYLSRFTRDMDKREGEKTGINIAVEVASELLPYVDGFYFITPFNRFELIVEIMKIMNPKIDRREVKQ